MAKPIEVIDLLASPEIEKQIGCIHRDVIVILSSPTDFGEKPDVWEIIDDTSSDSSLSCPLVSSQASVTNTLISVQRSSFLELTARNKSSAEATVGKRKREIEVTLLVDDWLAADSVFLAALHAQGFTNAAQSTDGGEALSSYRYRRSACAVPELLRWTRMEDALLDEVDLPKCESFALIRFSESVFIDLMLRSEDFVDFTALGTAIETLRSDAVQRDGCPPDTLFTFLLINFDKCAVEAQKQLTRDGRGDVSVFGVLDNATAFLAYDMNIELIRWKAVTELAEYLKTTTHLISERIHRTEPCALDFVMKASRRKGAEGMTANEREKFEVILMPSVFRFGSFLVID